MDSQSLPVLIAIVSLFTGILLCWLVMRGRVSAAAAQTKPEVRAELALAQELGRTLENDRQLAVANYEELKLQAEHWREALDLARQEQAQLAKQASQVGMLEARLVTLQDQEKANRQALLRKSASDTENAESLKLISARLVALENENTALKRNAAEILATTHALNQCPATREAKTPQLPALEAEVLALQTLAKTIQQEFELLAELQRNFTLTSTTVQGFS